MERSRKCSKLVSVGVLATLLCALALSAVARSLTGSESGQKWEYKTLALANIIVEPFGQTTCPTNSICLAEDGLSAATQKLNELGAEGWELVGFVRNPGEMEADLICRRPQK